MKNNITQETTSLYKTKPVQLAPGLEIGGDTIISMVGPCSVESFEQTHEIGRVVSSLGIRVLRGGAFKPRTSPFAFQGLGEEGLHILSAVAKEFGLLVVTEAMSVEQIPLVSEYSDIIQIGSRNMQHFPLLWAAGEADRPVLLKRGFMSTVEEWLMAAEHIAQKGNEKIILCERGIRGFDPSTRNVLDTASIALAKKLSPFPVIADPSHATGRADLVLPAARAAVAAGADGLLLEVHPTPSKALSDADQALSLDSLEEFTQQVGQVARALSRELV